MSRNFSANLVVDKQSFFARFIPKMRPDGLHYEVNVKGFPRFFMNWSPLGRYDLVANAEFKIPYALVLAASDAIEKMSG